MAVATDHKLVEEPMRLSAADEDIERFRRRMLEWPDPVEFVNNMYSCHPGDDSVDYFQAVFGE